MVPTVGLAPTANRLQGGCSAAELRGLGVADGDRTRRGAVTARRVHQFTTTTILRSSHLGANPGSLQLLTSKPSYLVAGPRAPPAWTLNFRRVNQVR